jgi:hypothetical protein
MDSAWTDQGQKIVSDAYSRYENMVRSFAQIVNGEKENPFTYDYELQLFKYTMLASGLDLA